MRTSLTRTQNRQFSLDKHRRRYLNATGLGMSTMIRGRILHVGVLRAGQYTRTIYKRRNTGSWNASRICMSPCCRTSKLCIAILWWRRPKPRTSLAISPYNIHPFFAPNFILLYSQPRIPSLSTSCIACLFTQVRREIYITCVD